MLLGKRHPIRQCRASFILTGGRYCNVRKAHGITLPLFLLLLAGLFPPFSSSRSDEHDDFPWPIDAARRISSTFGEYRPGRFHLGLDFKSNGVTGREVYALGDGYIAQVRTSPFGYGKGLYIKLDSGGTVVYGHLSGFLPEIEDKLFTMRIQNGTYDVNWRPTPNRYRVGKGQLVAFSGDTGSGPAHLHIEIRDENNVPENPFLHGFTVRDNIPPVLGDVALIPLDTASSVDGISAPRFFDPSAGESESFILTGAVGVAVEAHDIVNNTNNRLGVYRISLAVDSTIVFSKTYDKISYAVERYGAFDHLPGGLFGGRRALTALFRQTGNELPIYHGDGILTDHVLSKDGVHTLTIHAEDYFGNTAETSFTARFGRRPVFTACGIVEGKGIRVSGYHPGGLLESVELSRESDDGGWIAAGVFPAGGDTCDITVDVPTDVNAVYRIELSTRDGLRSLPVILSCGPNGNDTPDPPDFRLAAEYRHDRVLVRLSSSERLATLPEIVFEQASGPGGILYLSPAGETSWTASLNFPRTGENRVRIVAEALSRAFMPLSDSLEIVFHGCDTGKTPRAIAAPDSLFTLTVLPGTLYRPAPVVVDTVSVRASNGLRRISRGYRVLWGDYPVKKGCDIALTLPDDPPDKAALYGTGDGNGNGWRFISDECDGRTFRGRLGGSGYVAVLEDRHAPYVAATSPKPGRAVDTARPLIVGRVQDKGSGIEGSDSIVMTIDGIRVYAEYDYEGEKVSYRPHNPLTPGKHTVNLSVTDRGGNTRAIDWAFTVR